jgi:hypothetical protein
MAEGASRGFACKRLVARGEHLANLAQNRFRREIPELIELFKK